jgi:hypothetical protein
MFFNVRERLQNISRPEIAYLVPSAPVGIKFMRSSVAEHK